MTRKICPKCNGNGYHKEPIDTDMLVLAPITMGLSLMGLIGRRNVDCLVCDGAGYIEE